MSILVSLLLVAATSQKIEKPCPPGYDCKTGVYIGPPRQELFPWDAEKASKIYQTYWACHWQHLSQHQDFGSADGTAIIAAFQQATAACQSDKQNGDDQIDKILEMNPEYGDVKNRTQLRELARQQGGVVFAYLAAGHSGQRTKFGTMLESLKKYLMDNKNAPNQ